MNGGKYMARERGIIAPVSIHKRIEALIKDDPWIVVKTLSSLDEADMKRLKWVLTKV